jgi:N-acetylmuramoyl-L-alanine amidase
MGRTLAVMGIQRQTSGEQGGVMKTCALVIGHKKASPGAMNKTAGLTEFTYNDRLSMDIENAVESVAVQRVYRRTYGSLPDDINELAPDFIVSLHCNAFNERASGTEVLYYHRSQNGKTMADILNTYLVEALGLKNRGIKPKTVEDRGGYLLKMTHAPCVIAEPFFIDNDGDLKAATDNRDALVDAYASAIKLMAEEVM